MSNSPFKDVHLLHDTASEYSMFIVQPDIQFIVRLVVWLPICCSTGRLTSNLFEVRASQLAQAWERVVLEYQLQTRLKTLPTFRPDVLAFFALVFEAGIRELPFLTLICHKNEIMVGYYHNQTEWQHTRSMLTRRHNFELQHRQI